MQRRGWGLEKEGGAETQVRRGDRDPEREGQTPKDSGGQIPTDGRETRGVWRWGGVGVGTGQRQRERERK